MSFISGLQIILHCSLFVKVNGEASEAWAVQTGKKHIGFTRKFEKHPKSGRLLGQLHLGTKLGKRVASILGVSLFLCHFFVTCMCNCANLSCTVASSKLWWLLTSFLNSLLGWSCLAWCYLLLLQCIFEMLACFLSGAKTARINQNDTQRLDSSSRKETTSVCSLIFTCFSVRE